MGEYSQDFADLKTGFSDLKTLLEFQNDYITQLQEQATAQAELTATQEATQQANYDNTLDALNSISTNTQDTANKQEATQQQLVALQQEVIAIKDDQLIFSTNTVEGFWVIAVTIALAVGMKIFWENTLKW